MESIRKELQQAALYINTCCLTKRLENEIKQLQEEKKELEKKREESEQRIVAREAEMASMQKIIRTLQFAYVK